MLAQSADGVPNAQRAIVQEVIFEGEVRRYEVHLDGDETIVLKQTNRQGTSSPGRGAEVIIGWHDADARVVGTGKDAPWPNR